jgi:hypothetical protein
MTDFHPKLWRRSPGLSLVGCSISHYDMPFQYCLLDLAQPRSSVVELAFRAR